MFDNEILIIFFDKNIQICLAKATSMLLPLANIWDSFTFIVLDTALIICCTLIWFICVLPTCFSKTVFAKDKLI